MCLQCERVLHLAVSQREKDVAYFYISRARKLVEWIGSTQDSPGNGYQESRNSGMIVFYNTICIYRLYQNSLRTGSMMAPFFLTTRGSVSFWWTLRLFHSLPTGCENCASYCATLVYGYGKSLTKNCEALRSDRSEMMTLERAASFRAVGSIPAVLTRKRGSVRRFRIPLPPQDPYTDRSAGLHGNGAYQRQS